MDHAAEIKKYAPNADDAKVAALIKYLGVSLHNRDSSLVAASDPDELKTVHNNWCKKKLGVTDDAAIDAAIKKVVETMKGNNHKSRAAFYYLAAPARGLTGSGGAGRESVSARRVSMVDTSATPSTCAGRKWRWKAATVFSVASS